MMILKPAIVLTFLTLALTSKAANFVAPESAVSIYEGQLGSEIELPNGPMVDGIVPTRILHGGVLQQAWRIQASSTAAIMDAITHQYESENMVLNFRCAADGCGGFEFRYSLPTPSPKDFQVELSNYEYAELENEEEVVTILASISEGYVQILQTIIQLTDQSEVNLEVIDKSAQAATVSSSTDDRLVLNSVKFLSGSAVIDTYDPAELQALADRLATNSDETLYIIGHSDQDGGLQANLSISQKRAQSVVDKLISEFNVPKNRVLAQGVAFLAPIASNSTEEGRAQNRRVEALFLIN